MGEDPPPYLEQLPNAKSRFAIVVLYSVLRPSRITFALQTNKQFYL